MSTKFQLLFLLTVTLFITAIDNIGHNFYSVYNDQCVSLSYQTYFMRQIKKSVFECLAECNRENDCGSIMLSNNDNCTLFKFHSDLQNLLVDEIGTNVYFKKGIWKQVSM